ncbi:3-phosphoshikimate 1-carboxyvinyltransferase [Striga asiatica]|uniref:3-phosphoshikimate 1-carboxyvinyltransferase n=1 Tax=Striga asiatica TaxID=4170 RepID=A0A5A7QU60_STRAF|nr:3-phosphoshikimate 1-carboxyvinyltransferase [Striga asiatica]
MREGAVSFNQNSKRSSISYLVAGGRGQDQLTAPFHSAFLRCVNKSHSTAKIHAFDVASGVQLENLSIVPHVPMISQPEILSFCCAIEKAKRTFDDRPPHQELSHVWTEMGPRSRLPDDQQDLTKESSDHPKTFQDPQPRRRSYENGSPTYGNHCQPSLEVPTVGSGRGDRPRWLFSRPRAYLRKLLLPLSLGLLSPNKIRILTRGKEANLAYGEGSVERGSPKPDVVGSNPTERDSFFVDQEAYKLCKLRWGERFLPDGFSNDHLLRKKAKKIGTRPDSSVERIKPKLFLFFSIWFFWLGPSITITGYAAAGPGCRWNILTSQVGSSNQNSLGLVTLSWMLSLRAMKGMKMMLCRLTYRNKLLRASPAGVHDNIQCVVEDQMRS